MSDTKVSNVGWAAVNGWASSVMGWGVATLCLVFYDRSVWASFISGAVALFSFGAYLACYKEKPRKDAAVKILSDIHESYDDHCEGGLTRLEFIASVGLAVCDCEDKEKTE